MDHEIVIPLFIFLTDLNTSFILIMMMIIGNQDRSVSWALLLTVSF